MSSIDTVTNLDVGTLRILGTEEDSYGVPIYWTLEDYEHDSHPMTATITDVCLGGGSGEHPCLIVNLSATLLWLISRLTYADETNKSFFEFTNEFTAEKEMEPSLLFCAQDAFWENASVSEVCDQCYMGVLGEILDPTMWPLSTWISASKAVSRLLQEDSNSENVAEFEDFITAISLILLQKFPWHYLPTVELKNVASRLKERIEEQNLELRFCGAYVSAKKLSAMCAKLFTSVSEDNCSGKYLQIVDPTQEPVGKNIRAKWGFCVDTLDSLKAQMKAQPDQPIPALGLDHVLRQDLSK